MVSKRIIAMYENSNNESDSASYYIAVPSFRMSKFDSPNGLLLKIGRAKQEETLYPALFVLCVKEESERARHITHVSPPSKFAAVDLIAS